MSMNSASTANGQTARLRLRPIIEDTVVIAAALTGFAFADAARAQVPTVNIQETCQVASRVTLGLSGGNSQNDVEICLKSENDARDQMIKGWSTFEASDRTDCIQPKAYLPSYVEWLTCFEMNKIVRQLRQQGQTAQGLSILNPDGSFTLPTLPGRGMSSRSY
jgi:hypothetical protein